MTALTAIPLALAAFALWIVVGFLAIDWFLEGRQRRDERIFDQELQPTSGRDRLGIQSTKKAPRS